MRYLVHSFPILHVQAYIPLRCKTLALGPGVGLDPNATLLRHLTQNIQTCWYILALPNAKICVTPDANPDASQWNIGGVGPSGVGAGVGHVHFRFFVSISFVFGSQRKRSFQWNMGFSLEMWFPRTLGYSCTHSFVLWCTRTLLHSDSTKH